MAVTPRPCLASLEGEFNEEAMPKRKDLLRGENETCWHVSNEKKQNWVRREWSTYADIFWVTAKKDNQLSCSVQLKGSYGPRGVML